MKITFVLFSFLLLALCQTRDISFLIMIICRKQKPDPASQLVYQGEGDVRTPYMNVDIYKGGADDQQ